MSRGTSSNPFGSPAADALDRRVRAELVRTAYRDALYGAPFGIGVALLFGYAAFGAFPAGIVLPWLVVTLTCNASRLLTRWAYFRREPSQAQTEKWAWVFIGVSAATGLTWGVGAWLFYTPHDSIYRVMVMLVLAGLTTGASRLLAPIAVANLAYVYLSIGPLMARLLLNPETRSYILGAMCVLYLLYMSIAARQQVRTLRHTIRLGYENAELVGSLGSAKERAEKLNRDLSGEIARREVVETELRAASERAMAASRAKSEFLATMSHEIRTPMNGIIGMLRIVRDSPLSAAQCDHIEMAATSADTLLDLLSDILDFSKIEAGHLELERIVFSPATIAKTVTDILRDRATTKGLGLELDLDPDMPSGLIGDPTRIRQVLFNLGSNAIKFTHQGHVRIRLRLDPVPPQPNQVAISFVVEDTGIGIGEEALGRIFRPFTQADNSMSRRFGGTGLGLAISQKLVEAMGGKLKAKSTAGTGSVFQFDLQLARPGVADTARAAPADFMLPQLRGRILVVEDDRINQRVIGHFLKQMGLQTGLAEDGNVAIKSALAEPWDAILMDCQLPGIDGLEATRQIRARQSERPLPIIALTANASTQDRTACLAAGMNDFLTKPVRVELLAATLKKWLATSAETPS